MGRFVKMTFGTLLLLSTALSGCISTFQGGCTRNPEGGYNCNGSYTPQLPPPPPGERG